MMGKSKILSSSQITFVTFFSARAQHWLVGWLVGWFACLLSATANRTIMLSQNHFPDPNQHILTFRHLILLCGVTY
jgi:hypothetical protein